MGGTHKSGHAATVAEAGRKAELARDYYEDTKAKELKELDKKEVKLLVYWGQMELEKLLLFTWLLDW